MKRWMVALGAVALTCAVPRSTSALFRTPAWDRALIHNGVEWNASQNGANVLGEVLDAVESQGYLLFYAHQDSINSGGVTTLEFFRNLQEPYGAFSSFTHGTSLVPASGLPMIEFFQNPGDANAALMAATESGLVDPLAGEAGVVPIKVKVDPNEFGTDSLNLYATTIGAPGLQRLSQPRDGIVHLLVCDGADRYADWTTSGTATMAGYESLCVVPPAATESDILWRRLHGLEGARARTLKGAMTGTSMSRIPSDSGDSLVLAPWVIAVQPPIQLSAWNVQGPEPGYFQFDTYMHQMPENAEAGVRLSGNLTFWQPPHWELNEPTSEMYIGYILFPTGIGTGTVTMYGSQLRSTGGILVNSGSWDLLHYYASGDTIDVTYRTLDPGIAMALDRQRATVGSGGVSINFSTLWEQYSDSFTVARLPETSGVPRLPTIAASGIGGLGQYSFFDPGGAIGSRYQVVERQTGGRGELRYEVLEAQNPTTVVTDEAARYDTDSLATEVDAAGNPGANVPEGVGPGFYALIAPDSLTSSLGTYKSLWSARNINTGIVPLSDTEAHGGIAGYIQWAYGHGTRYVLLVGDANDAEWWDDPSRWVNGWQWPRVVAGGPHLPSQPTHDLIPTNYTADVDSPSVALSFYTPYYASDLPYADVDGDGTPDVRIGRLPVDSRQELLAYTAKLMAFLYRDLPVSGPFDALMTCARDNGRVLGQFIAYDADSVAAEVPPWWSFDQVTATNDPTWTYARREAVADSVANSGPDRMLWITSGAQRDIYANFWRLDQGWSMSHLQPPPTDGRFFVSLGFACGMGNFDQTENYTACDSVGSGTANCTGAIRPIPERLLLDPERGAIAVVGPTRGTFEHGNLLFARQLTKHLIVEGKDLGTAFMLTQGACITKFPEYTDLFRSYVLLGDPLLGDPTITAVAESPRVPRVGLGAARPNPFNPSTVLPVTIASRGRVWLRVFDAQGRLVRTLLGGESMPAGTTLVRWDGGNQQGVGVGSGVYFASMTADGKTYRRKLVMLK